MTNTSKNEIDSSRSQNRTRERVGAIWQNGGQGSRARFLWTDEESGEQLVLEVQGDEAFFAGLEDLGFERVMEDKQGPTAGAAKDQGPVKMEADDGSPKMSSQTSRRSSGTLLRVRQLGDSPRNAPKSISWNKRRGA